MMAQSNLLPSFLLAVFIFVAVEYYIAIKKGGQCINIRIKDCFVEDALVRNNSEAGNKTRKQNTHLTNRTKKTATQTKTLPMKEILEKLGANV